ncbi:DUF6029 family protein [Aureibacter tunicatorum]|uniref:DUF5723 domain-containing protein n=1 Tax=Aureibacter tunicatorum TaxID=866807 RepID=A0AAE4BSN3_9BACT|nr:DUF6029 family protein [Aureibacter tunicatorum]MDR6238602.1 hypothetical protein [Aureibacter tunicatorum]BDD05467.1 hypothetical protein AUTU_29500 [Aureibacter tunicatorum]
MNNKYLVVKLFMLLMFSINVTSLKGQGNFFGDIDVRQNFYVKDSALLPDPLPPQYEGSKMSTEAWVRLNYQYKFLTAGIRYDAFYNSGLRDPYQSLEQQGIGSWYVKGDFEKFAFAVGYFYDQFGSGAAFRAYEERAQHLDYAVQGLQLKYEFAPGWIAKGFIGKQKADPLQFEETKDVYDSPIRGLNIEGSFQKGKLIASPGASVVTRTLDGDSQRILQDIANAQTDIQAFDVKSNTSVYSMYSGFSLDAFDLNLEYNFKTKEASFTDDARVEVVNKSGDLFLASLSWAGNGLGIIAQYRRMENFEFRTSPLESQNNGLLSYIPSFSRANSYRLTARYSPPPQYREENAWQVDVNYKWNKQHLTSGNYSDIRNFNNLRLYQEMYVEHKFKVSKRFTVIGGLQIQKYNQRVYENKENLGIVDATTPFAEAIWKFAKRKSMRLELSHMQTEQDMGSWTWVNYEISLPHGLSFSASNMYNYGNQEEKLAYWSAFAGWNTGRHRLSLAYVQQPESVVCSGGVCRLEPAFNGVKVTLNASF